MKGDREASEALGGPRCLHDMIAAWCSWCLGHDETFALKVQRELPSGTDLVAELNRDLGRRELSPLEGLRESWRTNVRQPAA